MRISNAEQFPADAIIPEPELRHGVDHPQVDFGVDPLASMAVGTLYFYLVAGAVSLWQRVADGGGAGDWRLIN